MAARKSDDRKRQDYDLGDGVSIAIFYPDGTKPPMLHEDDTCVVSLDRDKFAACVAGLRGGGGDAYVAARVQHPVASTGPSRVMSPADREAALARIGEGGSTPTKPKPVTSEDLFREAGLDTNLFATIERAAVEG